MSALLLPPAPPMLKVHPRRQARAQARRAAADWHSCEPGINPSRSPAPPRRRQLRPGWGRPGGKGGGAIAFVHPGMRWRHRELVDSWASHHAYRGSTKRNARSAKLESPRVAMFHPRVKPFQPRVRFQAFGPSSLSLSNFSEEEGRKERRERREAASTSVSIATKLYPRVGTAIHEFSVAAFLSRLQCWRGFTAVRRGSHGATSCSLRGFPLCALEGGLRG